MPGILCDFLAVFSSGTQWQYCGFNATMETHPLTEFAATPNPSEPVCVSQTTKKGSI